MMHRNWPTGQSCSCLMCSQGVRFDFEDDNSGQRMSLLAVLPLSGTVSMACWRRCLRRTGFRLVNDAGESGKAAVSLPKRHRLDSGDALRQQFRPPGRLEWDEFGAEGAAASAAAINTRMAPPRIAFDQPFAVIVSREVATS
uniref:Uncharacterized protein n=1 Tax=Macrostomum lignano TaxID=282301 RepID=A0A1I8JNJ1_9PLAT